MNRDVGSGWGKKCKKKSTFFFRKRDSGEREKREKARRKKPQAKGFVANNVDHRDGSMEGGGVLFCFAFFFK